MRALLDHPSCHLIREFTVEASCLLSKALIVSLFRVLTFLILSGVFTPILPKPIVEAANSAATDLK